VVKVFITGVAGLLGSTLAKHLLACGGYTIVGVDNYIGGIEDNVPAEVDFYNVDILDNVAIKKLMEGCEIVFHAAALPYEGLSVWSPTITATSIVSGTLSVAMAALHNKVRLFINCSSMARYGDQQPPFTENMNTKPVDPYGLAKVQAEEHLAMLREIHGLNYVTVVPHNVIGVGQRYFDPFRNVVGIMINRSLQDKALVVYGDGKQKRSFSDAIDCIKAIKRIMDSDRDLGGQVYNIGPDHNEISILGLAQAVSKATNKELTIESFPDRPREVKNAYCSSAKVSQEFNYSADTTLNQTLTDMVTWIKPRVRPFEYHLEIEYQNEHTPKTWTKELI
jgi:UDP-glucose 4-epimerase